MTALEQALAVKDAGAASLERRVMALQGIVRDHDDARASARDKLAQVQSSLSSKDERFQSLQHDARALSQQQRVWKQTKADLNASEEHHHALSEKLHSVEDAHRQRVRENERLRRKLNDLETDNAMLRTKESSTANAKLGVAAPRCSEIMSLKLEIQEVMDLNARLAQQTRIDKEEEAI